MPVRDHVVMLMHQQRGIGRWVTVKVVVHGPFYLKATAEAFAEKAATGAPRVKWTLGDADVTRNGSTWIVETTAGFRTLVTVEKVRPSGIRRAWASIRTHLGDKPIRPSAARRSA